MKRSLMFLSTLVLVLSALFISSCGDDDDGSDGGEIPPALVKTLVIDETTWTFTYDEAHDNRLTKVDVVEVGEDPYSYTYDYSVAGKLSETEAGSWGEYTTVFAIDDKGRIVKLFWDAEVDDEFEGFQYNSEGFLVRWYESVGGDERNYYTATVADGNVTVHTSFDEDGTTVSRTKTFTYLPSASALNVSSLPQANLRNSERRAIGGLYGSASKKLVDFLELEYPGAPEEYVKNTNTYTFDDENRVVSITRTGVDSEGNPTDLNETFFYTYYDVE